MNTEPKILTDEQIDAAQEAAYRALVEKGYNGGMGGYQWDRASARAVEQAVLRSPEVQRLRIDAERYRFIRDGQQDVWCGSGDDLLDGSRLDAAIAKAMMEKLP